MRFAFSGDKARISKAKSPWEMERNSDSHISRERDVCFTPETVQTATRARILATEKRPLCGVLPARVKRETPLI